MRKYTALLAVHWAITELPRAGAGRAQGATLAARVKASPDAGRILAARPLLRHLARDAPATPTAKLCC